MADYYGSKVEHITDRIEAFLRGEMRKGTLDEEIIAIHRVYLDDTIYFPQGIQLVLGKDAEMRITVDFNMPVGKYADETSELDKVIP